MGTTQLLADYNFYRRHTNHYKNAKGLGKSLFDVGANPQRDEALTCLVGFCEEERLQSRLFLYSLFLARHFMFAPRFDQLTPKTKKTRKVVLQRYDAMRTLVLFESCMDHNRTERARGMPTVQVAVDLTYPSEALKRRYATTDNRRACMDSDETLGFHPLSKSCRGCVIAYHCAASLRATLPDFDIVAARRASQPLDGFL